MSHATGNSSLHYNLTCDPIHLTAHTPATLTLTIYNPTPEPIPLTPLTLTLPTTPLPHDTTLLTTTPETLEINTHHAITVTRTSPTTHTLQPPEGSNALTLTPRQSHTIQLTGLTTSNPGTATLLLAETTTPTPDDYHHIRTATWPSDPIVTGPTLNENSLSGTEQAELTWQYLANQNIRYELTYNPQPDDEKYPEITVPHEEILKYSGQAGSNRLTPVTYKTVNNATDKTPVYPTASPTPFVITAALGSDTRTFWTYATVTNAHTHAYNLQAATTHLIKNPSTDFPIGQYQTTQTDGFFVAIPPQNQMSYNGSYLTLSVTPPGAKISRQYILTLEDGGYETVPVAAGSGVFLALTGNKQDAGYKVQWQELGSEAQVDNTPPPPPTDAGLAIEIGVGGRVIAKPPNSDQGQLFTIDPRPEVGTWSTIQTGASYLCVAGSFYPVYGSLTSQQFKFLDAGNGTFAIMGNPSQGTCLVGMNSSGVFSIRFGPEGQLTPNQDEKWYLNLQGDGSYIIVRHFS
ncbi:RICIN domain-containing protein [Streptomyces violascens]|uniref:RICIN domain-containing protein n=1 Tax=Streptomyces violascens TaxID=67381 RepID=UPI00367BCFE3